MMDARQELLESLALEKEEMFTRQEVDQIITALVNEYQKTARLFSSTQTTATGLVDWMELRYRIDK